MRSPAGIQVFFVEREEFFDRSGLYGSPDGDYQDNAARFLFFSKCAVELARRLDPSPEILHAHNWQTAFIPLLVSDQQLPIRTVLSVHTLEYQGNFWSYDFGLANLPSHYFSPRGMEYYGSLNLLKTGILFADAVILPGPRWVSEAQTPNFGCGLDPILRENARKLEGVASGMDYLPSPLRRKISLGKPSPNGPTGPALLTVTDSMTSDGMERLLPAMARLAEAGVRLTVLGKVAAKHLAAMEFAQRRHESSLSWIADYSEEQLAGCILSADAILCPSPVEPDALVLRRGLAEGLPPIAAACGGLHQLAPAWSPSEDSGFSFPFYSTRPGGLVDAVRAAIECYRDPALWSRLSERAAQADNSWAQAAAETEAVYASVLARFGMLRAA